MHLKLPLGGVPSFTIKTIPGFDGPTSQALDRSSLPHCNCNTRRRTLAAVATRIRKRLLAGPDALKQVLTEGEPMKSSCSARPSFRSILYFTPVLTLLAVNHV